MTEYISSISKMLNWKEDQTDNADFSTYVSNQFNTQTDNFFFQRNYEYKVVRFQSFHPFFTLKLFDKELDICNFDKIYLTDQCFISLFTIKKNIEHHEINLILYNFYDEVSSVFIANYYLHPENHFTTEVKINFTSPSHDSFNSESSFIVYGNMIELIAGRKVVIKAVVYFITPLSCLEQFAEYLITFKASKGIKF